MAALSAPGPAKNRTIGFFASFVPETQSRGSRSFRTAGGRISGGWAGSAARAGASMTGVAGVGEVGRRRGE